MAGMMAGERRVVTMRWGEGVRARVVRWLAVGVACVAMAGGAFAAQQQTPARPIVNRIMSANPDTCSSSDSKREVIVLSGDFANFDKHGALLIVTQPGKPAVALPYDPKALIVPSFSYAPHSVTVLYDGTQWCHVTGAMTFQLALGGRLSNIFSMHIDGDDDNS